MISKQTKHTIRQYLVILFALFIAYIAVWSTVYLDQNNSTESPVWSIGTETIQTPTAEANDVPTAPQRQIDPCTMPSVTCNEMIRTVTAYNTVSGQTDSSPCISANGTDICKGMAEGKNYVATNELPFGSKVKIDGKIYEVVDRTNSRYAYRYDIAMPSDKIQEAKQWGVRQLSIEVL